MSLTLPSDTNASLSRHVHDAVDRLGTRPTDATFHVVRVPAPARGAELLFGLDPALDASFWADASGSEQVALGALATLSASGPSRFADVAAQAQSLFARLGDERRTLRLFGGFAFQPGRASGPEWRAFGEARFALPRLVYARSGNDAELLLVLHQRELAEPGARGPALALAEAALAALSGEEPRASSVAASVELDERPDDEYCALVAEIQAAIARGELEKVVLARRVGLTLPQPADPPRILRRLRGIAPECVRFAFRTRGATFLGATPERLVAKRGTAFETDALAGSIGVADAPAGRLMENQKERAEQAIVVRELVRSLEPLVAVLEHAPVPEIQHLRHVAHLRTRIRGELRAPLHVLELVERLHPTPAVGGVPTQRALAWIAEHEPDERGWYAGPIGWCDAAGDGEFAVALRSGLFRDRSGALYAGGGIMRGSSAASELAETRWKLAALLGALEVAP